MTKKNGDILTVNHLTIDIPKGDVFGFLEPNGASKTTTIPRSHIR